MLQKAMPDLNKAEINKTYQSKQKLLMCNGWYIKSYFKIKKSPKV